MPIYLFTLAEKDLYGFVCSLLSLTHCDIEGKIIYSWNKISFVTGFIYIVRNEQWVDRGEIYGKKIQENRKIVRLEWTLFIIYSTEMGKTDKASS